VHNPVAVRVLQGQPDLDCQRDGQLPGQHAAHLDQVLERRSLDVFLDDIAQLAVLAVVEHLDDVGVAEAGGRPGLGRKTPDKFRILRQVVAQNLDGDQGLFRLLVLCQVHLGHAALADRPDQPVAAADDSIGWHLMFF